MENDNLSKIRDLMLARVRGQGGTLGTLLNQWQGKQFNEDRSVMDNYRPPVPQTGYVNTEEPLGPPSVLGGLLSLDPTDYVGPNTLTKLAAGAKGLLSGAALAPIGMTSMRLKHYDPPLNVFTNPTRDEAVDLLNKTKIGELRAIQDPKSGNLHVWDAYRAVHEQIANELGLNYDELFDLLGRNGTGLHLFDNADQIKSFPYKVFKGDLPDK